MIAEEVEQTDDLKSYRSSVRQPLILLNQISESVQREDNDHPQWLLCRYHDQAYVIPNLLHWEQKTYMRFLEELSPHWSFLRPESWFLLSWNVLAAMAIMINFYEIPVSLCFTNRVYIAEFRQPWTMWINVFFLTVLFINFTFVRPFTRIYLAGKLITSNTYLLKRYMRDEFWFNLVSWFVLLFYIVLNNPNLIYAKMFFYLSFFCLLRIDFVICAKLQLMKFSYIVYRIVRLVLMLLLLVLWLGSIFFAIDYYFYKRKGEYYPVHLWLTNTKASQYLDGTFIDLYTTYEWYVWLVYAVYWTLQSVSLLGYGDITPRNPYEVAFCDVALVIITLIYALFISAVWKILEEVTQSETKSDKILKQYLKNYGIGGDTVAKLSGYAAEAIQSKQSQQIQLQILETLSVELRDEFLLMRQKHLYNSIPFFNKIAYLQDVYTEVLHYLAQMTKEIRYGPGEIICQPGSTTLNLCSVVLGSVELRYENSNFAKTLAVGSFFGTADFLCKNATSCEARALKFSRISLLSSQSFDESFKKFHNVYQKYRELYDEMKIYNRFELTGECCWSCTSKFHPTHHCPIFFEWLSDYRQFKAHFTSFLIYNKSISFRKYTFRNNKKPNRVFIHEKEVIKKYVSSLKIAKPINVDKIRKFKIYNPLNNF